jgi:hypothetical protein
LRPSFASFAVKDLKPQSAPKIPQREQRNPSDELQLHHHQPSLSFDNFPRAHVTSIFPMFSIVEAG